MAENGKEEHSAREVAAMQKILDHTNSWSSEDSYYSKLSDGVKDGAKYLYNEYAKPDFYKQHLAADPIIQKRLRDLGYQGGTQADWLTDKTSDYDYAKGHIGAANFVNEAERAGIPHSLAKGLGYLGSTLYQPGSWALNNLSGSPETFGEMLADWKANMEGVSMDRPGYQTDDELISQYPNRHAQAYIDNPAVRPLGGGRGGLRDLSSYERIPPEQQRKLDSFDNMHQMDDGHWYSESGQRLNPDTPREIGTALNAIASGAASTNWAPWRLIPSNNDTYDSK
jgi:hypothetical protein